MKRLAAARHAWAGLAALALLLLPGARADHAFGDAHVFIVDGARVDLAEVGNLSQAQVRYDLGEPEPLGGPFCEESNVTIDAPAGTFTFSESQNADGCAEVLVPVGVPAGAERLVVSFAADRTVRNGGPFNPGATHAQRFRIISEDGGLLRSKDYYNATSGSQLEPQTFVFDEPLGAGRSNLTLSWYFDDEGFQGERLTALQEYRATVSAIRLSWPGIRLAAPQVVQDANEVANGTHARSGFTARVALDGSVARPGANATLALATRHGPALAGIAGPRGTIALDDAVLVDDRDVLRVELPPGVLAAQGAGTYEFRYVSTRVLPAQAPPPEPARVPTVFYVLLVLPAPAALLAIYSAVVYRREAEGRYRRTSTGLLAIIGIGILYYASLVVYAIYGAGRRRMTTLPFEAEVTLVYVQLLLLLLFFAVTAVVVGRYFARAMRRDIEERRRQEERLRRSNEELERFAYVASHDLQEPLRKVAGFTSLLQRRYKGRLDKDADEMIQYAVDGATRMQALIRDILAYSRVGAGELDLKPVETSTIMELVVSDLGERIREEEAAVLWKDLPVVEADTGQLRQVLQNLVENGIKYRHPERRPRVKVSAERAGGFWRFSVTDNGVGIPADKLNEIFGIFRRLHGNEVPGTGIGLALVKKAVERHGGKAWAESRLGKGSTFHFTMPAHDGAGPGGLSSRTPAGLRGPMGTDATPA